MTAYRLEEWFGERILRGRQLRRTLFGQAKGHVLDVACGTRVNFPHFGRAADITSIELSPAMLELARQRAEHLELSVTLQEMDATQLEFPDQSFDTVTSALSTCTFPDLHFPRQHCRTARNGAGLQTRRPDFAL